MSAERSIEQWVTEHEIILFMKGTREAPRCGFSATVVGILDQYLEGYETVDVLADPEIREGIKRFSSWPTIPQLYVRANFVGGADIVREMNEAGELEALLGPRIEAALPEITLRREAIEALGRFWEGQGPPTLRLQIDRSFRYELDLDGPRSGDLRLEGEGYVLFVERGSAARADGMTLDFIDTPEGGGFKIDNPNEPPRVQALAPAALAEWIEGGKGIEIFDVRSSAERARARIEGSHLLDAAGQDRLEALSRDAVIVLYCHHGARSRAAAEHCIRMGFREVHDLTGGIDAYSQQVDPSIPRY